MTKSVLYACISMFALLNEYNTGYWNVSLVHLVAFIALFLFYLKMQCVKKEDKRTNVIIYFFALVFSMFMVVGKTVFFWGNITSKRIWLIQVLFDFTGYYYLFSRIILFIKKNINEWNSKFEITLLKKYKKIKNPQNLERYFAVLLMLGIVPYVLFFYPGTIFWDGMRQLNYYFGIWEWQNHDPAFSTWLSGTIVSLGRILGGDNVGLFLSTLFEVLLTTVVIFFSVKMLIKKNCPRWIIIIIMFYYAAFPVIRIYSITTCKDTPYAVSVLAFTIMISLILLWTDENKKIKWYYGMGLLLTSLAILNFRNDGVYVVWISLIAVLIAVKKAYKPIVLMVLIFVSIFHFAYSSFILPNIGVAEGSVREALSVPLRQTVLYLIEHPDDVTDQEREVLEEVFTVELEEVIAEYDTNISDQIKNKFVEYPTEEQMKDYFSVWFSQLLRHPVTYVKSYIMCYYGYIYPERLGDEQGIYFIEPLSGSNTGYFKFEFVEGFSGGRNILEEIARFVQNFPGLKYLYCPGAYTFAILLLAMALIIKRKYKELSLLTPVFSVLVINCMSPVNGRIRYILPIIYTLPFLIGIASIVCSRKERDIL